MWGKVGLIRTGDSLVRAIAQLSRWERLASRPFRMRRDLEVKNLVQVARCIAEAALWRENSVGAHYRADYPDVGDRGWKQHSRSIRIMDSENLKRHRTRPRRSGKCADRRRLGNPALVVQSVEAEHFLDVAPCFVKRRKRVVVFHSRCPGVIGRQRERQVTVKRSANSEGIWLRLQYSLRD